MKMTNKVPHYPPGYRIVRKTSDIRHIPNNSYDLRACVCVNNNYNVIYVRSFVCQVCWWTCWVTCTAAAIPQQLLTAQTTRRPPR